MGNQLDAVLEKIDDKIAQAEKPKRPRKKKTEEQQADHSVVSVVEEWLNKYYEFRFNLVRNTVEFRSIELGRAHPFQHMEDYMFDDIYWRMFRSGIKFSQANLKSYLRTSYVAQRVNPVQEYYESLQPVADAGYFATLVKSVKLIPLEESIDGLNVNQLWVLLLKRWLIACYYCNMGWLQNEVCLVLVGAQGTGKSTWLDRLCPTPLKDYGTRTKLDLSPSNKDTLNVLAEKAFINIDDQLVGLFRKDHEMIKNLITLPDISLRKAYAMNDSKRKRIANFTASVNDASFLTDTENRRYLCFEVEDCKLVQFEDYMIDGLWAEVKYWVEVEKEQPRFTQVEKELQKAMNENFTAITPEREWLLHFFQPIEPSTATDEDLWLQSGIMEYIQTHIKYPMKSHVLSKELERAGFQKKAVRKGKQVTRFWVACKIRDNLHSQPSTPLPF